MWKNIFVDILCDSLHNGKQKGAVQVMFLQTEYYSLQLMSV